MANLVSTTITGTLDSTSTITGPGSGISAINASNVSSGTLASDRLPTVPTTKGGTGLTSIGSADQVLKVNSGGTALEFGDAGGGMELFNIVKVTTTSTYTPTAGTQFVRVYATGGGGGSGGWGSSGTNDSGRGSGGSGGNTGVKHYTATELGATASISIGSGGTGGTGSSTASTNGGTGGNTTFNPAGTGATLTGYGGKFSYGFQGARSGLVDLSWNTSTGNADYIHFGELAEIASQNIVRAGTTDYFASTAGGRSYFGAGGAGQLATNGNAENGLSAAANSGGGGGGGIAKEFGGSPPTFSGGNGGSGVVVIEEYA